MSGTIVDIQSANAEVVLQERVVTNEFKVVEIHEHVSNRFVRAEVELGPFTTETRPNGETETRGSGRRGVMVWHGAEYDAVRDTWTNADLMAAVRAKL
jgi:hypothetical protein